MNDYPDKVKAISDAGHEIGNHSLTHPHMSKLSPEQMKSELSQFDNLLEPIIGRRTKLFRAPYGEYDDRVIKTVREAGYEVIQWNIDTVDWKPERSAQTILDTVLPKLSDGSIILCHNNGYKIEQYLPTLIESALAQGYSFVTVSDLLLDGETLIDVNGVQKPAQMPNHRNIVRHCGRGGLCSPPPFFAYFYLYYVFLHKNCETIPILIKKT